MHYRKCHHTSVRCILYIVFSPSVRGFPAYLCPIHVLYICGLWPPDNASCLFITWYQSPGLGHPHAATRALYESCFFFDLVRPPPSPATLVSVGLDLPAPCLRPYTRESVPQVPPVVWLRSASRPSSGSRPARPALISVLVFVALVSISAEARQRRGPRACPSVPPPTTP
jgi:hypothetical protein